MKKTAVVLFNLGGPDSKESIRPFLFNFFMDKNIIPAPLPLRWFVATMIASRRAKREAGTSYSELGNKSPLLENSRAQAVLLEQTLNKLGGANFKTFVAMRYWHPMAAEIARDVQNWYPDQIILLPLYPQFSTTTTWSSLGAWEKAVREIDLRMPTASICCYPFNEGFIRASTDNIRKQYEQACADGHASPRILFSAHGLPESVIAGGDPYQWQCEQTAEKIVNELKHVLGIENPDWAICYQSRVGPKKWIGPSTENEIRRAAADKKPVIIYPHAFTQEHVETLVELDIEYREIAHEAGMPDYYRAATVSTHPEFINGLASLVRARLENSSVKHGAKTENDKMICPENFSRCCMRAQDFSFHATGTTGP